jgi:hypothetical protein
MNKKKIPANLRQKFFAHFLVLRTFFELSTLQDEKTRSWRDFLACRVVPPKVVDFFCLVASHQKIVHPPPFIS